MVPKLVVEFIGTFFLVFTVGMTVKGPDAGALAALAIGSSLMVMVYAGGHFSGGHYNPAVTLGVTLRGKATWAEAIPYWGAQFAAGVVAALLVLFIKGSATPAAAAAAAGTDYSVPAKLLVEFLFTFALVYVVLNVRDRQGDSRQLVLRAGDRLHGRGRGVRRRAGLGWSVQSGGRSGCRGGGALREWVNIWIPLVADFAGGAAAALLFNALDMGGDKS